MRMPVYKNINSFIILKIKLDKFINLTFNHIFGIIIIFKLYFGLFIKLPNIPLNE